MLDRMVLSPDLMIRSPWPPKVLGGHCAWPGLIIFLKWVNSKSGFMVSVFYKLSFPTLTISYMENLRNRYAKKAAV